MKNWERLRLVIVLPLLVMVSSCESISGYLWYHSLKPDKAFEESELAINLDYSAKENWAAHPGKSDNSDISIVSSVQRSGSSKDVDVFFIHPTTYYSSESWNQPLGDQQANALTDNWVLLNQVGIFSECCNVYTPRYRQATLYAVLSDHVDGDKALELAYQDVKDAFEYFLDKLNQGRPIIIASHSQGSWHSLRLIEERVVSSPQKEKLVAAYLVGMPLPADKLKRSLSNMPVCSHEAQSGCFVAWNTVTENADTRFYQEHARVWYGDHYEANQDKKLVCVNPLTWSVDEEFANPSLNIGGVNFKLDGAKPPTVDIGVVGARCSNGMLYITQPATQNYDWFMFGKGNFHMHDYDLFYMNIKENVQSRIKGYFE